MNLHENKTIYTPTSLSSINKNIDIFNKSYKKYFQMKNSSGLHSLTNTLHLHNFWFAKNE